MWDRFTYSLMSKYVFPHARVFDAGMGIGLEGYHLRINHFDKELYIEGGDIHKPSLEIAKKIGNAYDKIDVLDVRQPLPYQNNEFDLGLGIAVLAHLEKDEGLSFIKELSRISKHVIISAPTKSTHNHVSINNDPDIEPLAHKSVWSHQDFPDYQIRGFYLQGRTKQTLLDTWLYPPLYTLSAINPWFTKFMQYLVIWK